MNSEPHILILTVQRGASESWRSSFLSWLEHDAVDVGQVVHARAINEELKATNHGDHGQSAGSRLIPMANTE